MVNGRVEYSYSTTQTGSKHVILTTYDATTGGNIIRRITYSYNPAGQLYGVTKEEGGITRVTQYTYNADMSINKIVVSTTEET